MQKSRATTPTTRQVNSVSGNDVMQSHRHNSTNKCYFHICKQAVIALLVRLGKRATVQGRSNTLALRRDSAPAAIGPCMQPGYSTRPWELL